MVEGSDSTSGYLSDGSFSQVETIPDSSIAQIMGQVEQPNDNEEPITVDNSSNDSGAQEGDTIPALRSLGQELVKRAQ